MGYGMYMIKKLFKICLVLIVLLWGVLQIANYVIAFKFPTLIKKWIPEAIDVSIANIKKTGGLLGVGLELDGVDITLPKQNPLHIKTVLAEAPLWWPPQYRIRVESDPVLSGDIKISRKMWQVQYLRGKLFNFSFDVSGEIDRILEIGELSVRTQGLKSFIKEWINVPVWLDFLLKDAEQQFTLKPQNGSLMFYGIPLMKL